MEAVRKKILFCGTISTLLTTCKAQEFCRAMNYWCKEGHCCGRGKCCTYYYELWWFWFVWLAIAIAGICCFYQKKGKHSAFTRRFRRNRHSSSHNTNNEVTTNTEAADTGQTVEPDKVFKLPTYEELRDLSTDPPTYVQIFGADGSTLSQSDIVAPSVSTSPPGGPPVYTANQSESNISTTPTTSDDRPPQYSSCPKTVDVTASSEPSYPRTLEDGIEAGLLDNEEPIATTASQNQN